MKERRRETRIKKKPRYQIKARVNVMGTSSAHYFEIENLSLNGICLQAMGGAFDFSEGDRLEIMIYRKNVSIKVMADVLAVQREDDTPQYRARIIGIDQEAREQLSEVLKEMAGDATS